MLVIGGRYDGERGLLRLPTVFIEVNAGVCAYVAFPDGRGTLCMLCRIFVSSCCRRTYAPA